MNARTGICSGLTCLVLAGLLIAAAGAQSGGEPVELAGAHYACESEVGTLRLQAESDLTFDVFAMRDPYRVVLDLVGVKAPWKVTAPDDDPLVADLRCSLWKDTPTESIVRYVLETRAEVEFTVERSGDGLALVVWSEVPDDGAPGPQDAGTADSADAQETSTSPAPGGDMESWGPMLVPFGPPAEPTAEPAMVGDSPPEEGTGKEIEAPPEWFAEIESGRDTGEDPADSDTNPGASIWSNPGVAELAWSEPGTGVDEVWPEPSPVDDAVSPDQRGEDLSGFNESSGEGDRPDEENWSDEANWSDEENGLDEGNWSDEGCPEVWGDELILAASAPDPLTNFVGGRQAEALPEEDWTDGDHRVATRTADAAWSAPFDQVAPTPAPPAEVPAGSAPTAGGPAAAAVPGEVDLTDEAAHYDPYEKLIARHRPGAVKRAHETWLDKRPRHDDAPDFGTGGGGGFGQAASSAPVMSLDVQGANVHTVLRSIAEYAGVNIVADANVKGAITLRAVDLPWYEMLDAVSRSLGLVAMDHGSVIRVATERTAQEEALARESAARKQEDLMPLETAIVTLRYANADELKTVVDAMRTGRGSVEIDERTNSLIVTDIAPRLEELKYTLEDLDTETLQIEITAELVDVDATMSRQLGIAWGLSNLHSVDSNASGSVSMTADDVVGTAGNVQVGVLRSFGEVQARIQALATDNKADIISTPRITTVNNRMARILVGKEVPVITMDEAGNAITEYKQVGIALEVTPHVNSDNEITLDIHPEISDLSQEATVQGGVVFNTTEADTRVMVSNGQTAVIGGLLNTRKTKFQRGVPILKSVPVLGYLFRSTDEQDDKRELLIFVTPRIVAAEKH